MKKYTIIPLGFNCSVTVILEKIHNSTYERSPFEWNSSKSIDKIVELFSNNFDNFINEDIIPSNYFDSPVAYRNEYYDIIFNHDQTFDSEKKLYYFDKKNIIEKYNRRIKRIYEKINEADTILFLRVSPNVDFRDNKLSVNLFHGNPYPTDEDAINKLNKLKDLFSDKNIEIYYINTEETFNNFITFYNDLKQQNNYIFI